MDLETYLDRIAKSNPEDWTRITQPLYLVSLSSVEGNGKKWVEAEHPHAIYTYKHDLSISIVAGLKRSPWEYVTDWTERFPDPNARGYWLDFLFNCTQILRTLIVSVDGGNAGLPSPKEGTMNVPRRQYEIVKLTEALSGTDDFDAYFSRAGMKIVDTPWPE